MTLQALDRELLALHAKLRETTNLVVQHRIITQINQLLDERLKLTK